ncbi:hypothetical protein [Effusibacillus consociatus]|uniref:Glycosyltransferase RgtA/B/C/D-like domain-containing protein n=1 Tax=Effusibacillus consociatus TaxID=1117041 RepID=A0ABV9PXY8_9BACL
MRMRGGRRAIAHLALLTLFAVTVRLLFVAPYPTGWDDVDFALALEQYDLARMQPHFPGYPVYILAAHLFHSWMDDPFLTLTVLSAVAGGFTVIPLWLLFHEMGSAAAARLTVWMYTVAPLPLITSIQPMSDSLGAFLAAWLAFFSWSAAAEGRLQDGVSRNGGMSWALAASGITLGLLLGVRVSYLALSLLWLWASVQVLRNREVAQKLRVRIAVISCGAGAFTCCIWVTALILSTGGIDSFLALAVSFTGGHFSDWGGTYQAGASLADRAKLFLFRQIGGAGLGTIWWGNGESGRWISFVMAGIGISGLAVRRDRLPFKHRVFLFVWIIPYLLWAFFAQNVEKPRHILPLLPPLLYLLVVGLEGIAYRVGEAIQRIWNERNGSGRILTVFGMIWIAALISVSYPILKEADSKESPMVQLARYVKANVQEKDSLIFTWEEQRVLEYMSPDHTSIRLRKWEDFRTEILQYEVPPRRILGTSAMVAGLDREVSGFFQPVAVFQGNPWLYPTYHRIVLYEGTPLLLEELRRGEGETAWKSKHY